MSSVSLESIQVALIWRQVPCKDLKLFPILPLSKHVSFSHSLQMHMVQENKCHRKVKEVRVIATHHKVDLRGGLTELSSTQRKPS